METNYGKILRLLATARDEALEYRNHGTVAYTAKQLGMKDKAEAETRKSQEALILLRSTLAELSDLVNE